MYISRIDRSQVSTNFNASEFYSTSFDAPEVHFFDSRLITLVQKVRSYYKDVPIRITSTYRTKSHQMALGGSDKSKHLKGMAVDFQFTGPKAAETHKDFLKQVREQKELFVQLRILGLGGVGLYSNFIHFDTRKAGKQNDEFGTFAYWDNESKKKKVA